MSYTRKIVAPALLAMVTLSGCSLEAEAEPLVSVRYDVPQANLPVKVVEGCWAENTSIECPVLIQQDGTLTHRGVAIDATDIHGLEKERRERRISTTDTIAAHPNSEFFDVIRTLAEIFPDDPEPELSNVGGSSPRAKTVIGIEPPYWLVEMEQYRDAVEQPTAELIAEFEGKGFIGGADEYALRVWVGYRRKGEACIIKIHDGKAVTSRELYDMAFKHLEGKIENMGGIEAILEDSSTIDRLLVRLQSDVITPWRCIAAATTNLEQSGWPRIQFEVMPSDNQPTASE